MISDIEFEADDITEAFIEVSKHFKKLSEFEESDLIISGSILINKKEEGE